MKNDFGKKRSVVPVGAESRAPQERREQIFLPRDGYTESLDMASALHSQTILATKYAREPITDPFGLPMRCCWFL